MNKCTWACCLPYFGPAPKLTTFDTYDELCGCFWPVKQYLALCSIRLAVVYSLSATVCIDGIHVSQTMETNCLCPGPCITTAIWYCHKLISQWQCRFHLKAVPPLVKSLVTAWGLYSLNDKTYHHLISQYIGALSKILVWNYPISFTVSLYTLLEFFCNSTISLSLWHNVFG